MRTYEIIEGGPKTLIRCLICRHLSSDREHVTKRYCPMCQRLHVTVADDVRLGIESAVYRARPDLSERVRSQLVSLVLDMLDPANTAA